jgi:hypothetical protein
MKEQSPRIKPPLNDDEGHHSDEVSFIMLRCSALPSEQRVADKNHHLQTLFFNKSRKLETADLFFMWV